ncbi:arabinofuranosyltransferase [Nocardioides dongkuii]|uniref:arabinofuranosyltransferase n=1 Tax=Nocardioides dongkuii TaxID=2760089 RepID=UPI0015F8DDDB|nr:arabinofuranosyltransferase [Nocardioides dongkuii]
MPLRPWLLLLATALGAAAAALVVAALDVRVVEHVWRERVTWGLTCAAGLAGAAVALVARRSRARAADVGVVLAGVLLATAGTAALHGTRWGWAGLFADSSFRTQMATRYAETAALVDYGYADLPAYYPPALGWLQGRLAAVSGIEGWEAVKPVQLAVAVLVPVAAYLLWRQVVGPIPAVAVAGLVSVWTAHPQKPDEWLVLTCLLPWWLLAVRDVRAPGVERWPAWRLGLVLGLLMLVHTYWFLPFGVATVLALGYDTARGRGPVAARRPSPLPWRRALAIGAVGLAVSAVSWLPVLVARLRLPADSLQLRFAVPEGNRPPVPLLVEPLDALDTLGVLVLVGALWLAWADWRWVRRREAHELAGALALAVAGTLATLALGAVGERYDVGLLAFKTRDAFTMVLLVCGVLGLIDWWGRLPVRRGAAAFVPVLAAALAGGHAGHHLATLWVTGPPALLAHTTRYPDGSVPSGTVGQDPYYPTLFVDPDDPSVAEVRSAWRELRPDVPLDEAVLVTSQVDLLATTPVQGFLAYKSIYSHPNGQFEDRVALLEEVARCDDSACAAGLLRDNGFDEVDGLVLRRVGDELVLPFMVDDFPDRTRREQVTFPDELFSGPEFVRRELGPIVVVAVVP